MSVVRTEKRQIQLYGVTVKETTMTIWLIVPFLLVARASAVIENVITIGFKEMEVTNVTKESETIFSINRTMYVNYSCLN